MRWVVELPAPSGGTAATVTVDADSWAGALTHARGGSPIKKFRCEFDAENVVRVLDLGTRDWYTIRPIRAVGADGTSQRPAVVVAENASAPQPFAPASSVPPPVAEIGTVDNGSSAGAAPLASPMSTATPVAEATPVSETAVVAAVSPATAEPSIVVEASPSTESPATPGDAPAAASPAVETAPTGLVADPSDETDDANEAPAIASTLLFSRDQDPNGTNPLTYRERVFAVPAGTTPEEAERVARHQFTALKRALATRPRGRYVVIAVFDHEFTQRPRHSPLVELRWKDWRGEIAVAFPPRSEKAGDVSVPADAAPAAPAVEVASIAAAQTAQDRGAGPEAPKPEPSTELVSSESPSETSPSEATPTGEPGSAQLSATATAPTSVDTVQATPSAPTLVQADAVSIAASPAEPGQAPAPEFSLAKADTAVTAPVGPERTPPETNAGETSPGETSRGSPETPDVVSASNQPTDVPEASTARVETPQALPAQEVEPAVDAKPLDSGAPTEAIEAEQKSPEPPLVVVASESVVVAAEAQVETPKPTPRTLAKRLRGKDLLSELFDDLIDLSHIQQVDEAANFTARLLLDRVQCDASGVSLYDIDKDEFVVAAVNGADGSKGRREKASRGAPGLMVRRKVGVIVERCESDDALLAEVTTGGAVFAPAMHRDRLFAMVRLHRVAGAEAFQADELDAVSYVAAQLGEFLATHSKRVGAAEFAEASRNATKRNPTPPRR